MAETEIVWLEDFSQFPYLREVLTTRDVPQGDNEEKVIGYSKGTGEFHRVWTWRPGRDGEDEYEKDLCPAEAVLPSSIRPNTCSLDYRPFLARENGFEATDRFSEVGKSNLLKSEKELAIDVALDDYRNGLYPPDLIKDLKYTEETYGLEALKEKLWKRLTEEEEEDFEEEKDLIDLPF